MTVATIDSAGEERCRILDTLCLDDDTLFMDGYDDCIAGVVHSFGRPPVVAYDYDKVIKKLMSQGMTLEEATEWWSYNQVGAWMGEYTPVFFVALERAGD